MNAPAGDYVFCVITKNQADERWEASTTRGTCCCGRCRRSCGRTSSPTPRGHRRRAPRASPLSSVASASCTRDRHHNLPGRGRKTAHAPRGAARPGWNPGLGTHLTESRHGVVQLGVRTGRAPARTASASPRASVSTPAARERGRQLARTRGTQGEEPAEPAERHGRGRASRRPGRGRGRRSGRRAGPPGAGSPSRRNAGVEALLLEEVEHRGGAVVAGRVVGRRRRSDRPVGRSAPRRGRGSAQPALELAEPAGDHRAEARSPAGSRRKQFPSPSWQYLYPPPVDERVLQPLAPHRERHRRSSAW